MTDKLQQFILFSLFLNNTAEAQSYGTLHANDVEFEISSSGRIGSDQFGGAPTFTVSGTVGSHLLHSAGLWLSGLDDEGQLRLAAHLFGTGRDFFPGPLTVSGEASVSQDVSDQFDHVWKINSFDIDTHRSFFDCMNDPFCNVDELFPNGYNIPDDFVTWPAQGDTLAGQAAYLAPFFDYNSDGSYSAAAGDHPCLIGDQALFTIFNDKLLPHSESQGVALGVEVHMMPFAFRNASPALEQTVFIQFKVINRSNERMNSVYCGIFMDPDMGCAIDDLLGTDVERSALYAYNGDNVDENCFGVEGFGTQPPALGLAVLRGPLMDADISDNIDSPMVPAYNGSGFGDGQRDNERYGLCNTMTWLHDGPYPVSNPSSPGNFYNYLQARWKNDLPQTYGGTGYNTDTASIPSAFLYPGTSDPLGVGTGGLAQPPWTSLLVAPTDRRGLASMGPFTMEPVSTTDFLVAYIYARTSQGDAIASVSALQQRVDSVRAFAEEIPGMFTTGDNAPLPCTNIISGVRERRGTSEALSLFPNPANEVLVVRTEGFAPGALMLIHDALGQLVGQFTSTGDLTRFDVSDLGAGLYTVHVIGDEARSAGRFIKE